MNPPLVYAKFLGENKSLVKSGKYRLVMLVGIGLVSEFFL
jgi:hypothetical protein